MDEMIEMDTVKNSFVTQILLILMLRRHGHSLQFKKMHTVFSGPPGVGKTTMSILVAKIWSAFNIMDKSKPIIYIEPEMKVHYKKDIVLMVTEINDKLSDILITLDKSQDEVEIIPEFIKDVYSKSQDSCDLCQTIIDRYSKYFTDTSETSESITTKKEDSYIVLGRGDFVGSYQGETSIKTKKILDENKGKIIIIEEAYTLSLSDRDTYGMEALTLINRYMDEHSDDYIFIFNGYIDKLEQTIFSAQPGLRRRIQWQFNIEKYSPKGVFRIFQKQLDVFTHPLWTIEKSELSKFEEFFIKNIKYFPSYGGDTERLILEIQLKYGELFFEQSVNTIKINYNILQKAFDEYKKTSHINKYTSPPIGMYI
jgi:hypothetical protein